MSQGTVNIPAASPDLTAIGSDGETDSPVLRADQVDITATLNGDEQGYARLVARYEAVIATQMWRFTRDLSTHEELVQEVFVEAYTSLSGFRGHAPFEHWLRRIATRVGYRFWRKESRERDRRALVEEWKHTAILPAVDQTPSHAAECLFRLLETLPAKDRLVLTLFYFEGWDMAEIADHVGWSRTLVKVRAHRARRKLRALLEAEGFNKGSRTIPDAFGEVGS